MLEPNWSEEKFTEIRQKAKNAQIPMRGYGMIKSRPSFSALAVVPAQLATLPIDGVRTKISTEVTIGDGLARPLELAHPFFIASMSLGGVSKDTKKAIALGASKMGIATNTGEGGTFPEEIELVKKEGGKLITQMSTSRFGVDLNFLRAGDAVEIMFGQGGKAGMGGILFAEKMDDELYDMRKMPKGSDSISPPRHLDMESGDDLVHLISIIRETTSHEVPIIIKIAAGNVNDDLKVAIDAGADAILIDGSEAGAMTVPNIIGNEAGLPLIGALSGARKYLKTKGLLGKVRLLAEGGIRDGADIYKCLALGADAVGIGTAALVALGCEGCYEKCPTGECPQGIASNGKRLNWRKGGNHLYNYLKATGDEVKLLTAISGHHTVAEVNINDVMALTYDMASVTGARLIGYGRPLPMWQH